MQNLHPVYNWLSPINNLKGIAYQKFKMAISSPSDMKKYLRDILECPICIDTISTVPVFQCTNGHIICKICVTKLKKCPICRNDSMPARNLALEKIMQDLLGIKSENEGTFEKTKNFKWGTTSSMANPSNDVSNQFRMLNAMKELFTPILLALEDRIEDQHIFACIVQIIVILSLLAIYYGFLYLVINPF